MDAASLRPLGVGEILDVAIKLYRARFSTLVKAVAVLVGPVYALTALVQLSLAPTEEDAETFQTIDPVTGEPEVDFGIFFAFFAGLMVVGIAYYIAGQLATAASFRILTATYLGDEIDWKPSLRFALGRMWSLVWLSFVMGVAFLIGFILCVIPAIYLYGAFAVAVPVLLVENLKGTRALKRSRQLVKGRWWPVIAAVVLGILMAQIVAFLLTMVISLPLGISGNDVAATIGNALANTVAAVLVTPFSAAVILVVYFDLRVRKEGFDVELLASQIGIEPSGRPTFLPPPPPAPPASGAQPPFWPPPPGWRPPDA